MNKVRKSVVVIAMVLALGFLAAHAVGRSRNLNGVIIAFDPLFSIIKHPSFVKNLEVTIADVGGAGKPQRLVKVVFEGFGELQVSQEVLEGEKPFQARAVRDKSCDEAHPRVLSKWPDPEHPFAGSGPLLLNQAHRDMPLPQIEKLDCYRVDVGVEKQP